MQALRVVDAAIVKHMMGDQPREEGQDTMPSSVVWLAPTLSLAFIGCTSLKIPMVLLEIFVVIPKARKKDIFPGSRPIFWAGIVTSHMAIGLTWAKAGTLLVSSMSLLSVGLSSMDTKPTLLWTGGNSFFRADLFSKY